MDDGYGISGTINAKKISIRLTPGKPIDFSRILYARNRSVSLKYKPGILKTRYHTQLDVRFAGPPGRK
jgi:hypothetical protein